MILKKPEYAWYAIYTKVNSEKKIFKNLQEQKIESYLPLRKSLRQWSDRKKWIEEPLFRCYLFVRVSYKEFFDVLSVPGVVCYISFGGRPQSIPDYQINNIKTLVRQDNIDITVSKEKLRPGYKAEVLVGPLKGLKGEIVEISGQYRILIRIDTMGLGLHANISKDEVKILEPDTDTDEEGAGYPYHSQVSAKRKFNNISVQ
ncbi:UpxY family transcription antiterminator [Maribellus comscasis]|uniref:UpxY family transcription antiterminator n=1 Tax=Maribellus comscasis TaxID=2681766 RepID=A0A6I6K210_9BACT|nr:UpxY family transcription antiterminator [Maribellus comscasis]QGY43934.1 UpxY family transcription antiterminator [Maribellus comscasis]